LKNFIIFLFLIPLLSYSQTPNSEYADKVVDAKYKDPNDYPYYTQFYGGGGYTFPVLIDIHKIEGANEYYFVSLPTGSYITLEFTNNKIIDYPNQDDIFVTENGCNNEQAEVWISKEGVKFTYLGTVDDCYISSLDLATINFKDAVRFVKIVGLDLKGGSPGFDLINVKGLPGSSVEVKEQDPTEALADSLQNLSRYGYTASLNEKTAGKEWVIESKDLTNAEISLYDPQKNYLPINYISISANRVVIDAAGLTKGIYTLEIKNGSKIISQKISII